jgi:hypothetical protein
VLRSRNHGTASANARTALRTASFIALASLSSVLVASEARAGCGCDKPPPLPAQVRPQVTYPGTRVVLFSPAFRAGESYQVTFRSMAGATATVGGTVVTRRDLADGARKAQLPVVLPALPLGPASITVTAPSRSTPVLTVPDRDFTVAGLPVAIPDAYGSWSYPDQKAAVDRDGVVYLTLDLTDLTQPLLFDAQAHGLPLRFEAEDVVFTNVQGFLMQRLVEPDGESPIPGMSVSPSGSAGASDTLRYSRHEFRTYFLDHDERLPHAVDASDDGWHANGTRHIDHDHLVIAIVGHMPDGRLLPPGATSAFELKLKTYSLFHRGLAATSSVSLVGGARTSSFDPASGAGGHHGDVFANGSVEVRGGSTIDGDATARSIVREPGSRVTGRERRITAPETFMSVSIPRGVRDLGALTVSGGATRTLVGPGSFKVSKVDVSNGATLRIDNSAGPVTLYATGNVLVTGGGKIVVADPNPEMFALYVSGAGPVTLTDSGSFYGVVYAPTSAITLTGGGLFTGAFVGERLSASNGSAVRYDETLAGW